MCVCNPAIRAPWCHNCGKNYGHSTESYFGGATSLTGNDPVNDRFDRRCGTIAGKYVITDNAIFSEDFRV